MLAFQRCREYRRVRRAGHAHCADFRLRHGFLYRPTQRRHFLRLAGKEEVRERPDRRLRKNLRRRIRQRRKKISSAAISRSDRPAWLLHRRRKILTESFSAFAAEIWRSRHLAFLQSAVPSDFEDLPGASGN